MSSPILPPNTFNNSADEHCHGQEKYHRLNDKKYHKCFEELGI
jgi:hypothetical protein